jgi:hypothetical protein
MRGRSIFDLRWSSEEVEVSETKNEGERDLSKDIPCSSCEGRGWSRSASGRCTFCHGDGVLHYVLHQNGPGTSERHPHPVHPGMRAWCDVHACRYPAPASASLSLKGAR